METKVILFALGLLYVAGTPTVAATVPRAYESYVSLFYRSVNSVASQGEERLMANRWVLDQMFATGAAHSRKFGG